MIIVAIQFFVRKNLTVRTIFNIQSQLRAGVFAF
jgi:hypothetical protein